MFSRYNEISVTKLESILMVLSTPGSLNLDDYDLLIYGGGGQSKSFYNNLSKDPGVEILWTGWSGPKWSSFLSFIPGQAGLLKVLKQDRLKTLYEDLASHSVSDFYYVPRELTGKILNAVREYPTSHDPKKVLKNEISFLFMQCEMDETVITNNQECYLFDVAMGPDLSGDLKALFQVFDVIR
jgi:hypothetical protein